ncbi:MAG: IS607 family transposase [Chitinophagaceae bacterium]|nr:IS607 family transposase [Chitinophagaceae bacterium]
MEQQERYLGIKKLAEKLSVSQSTLRRWETEGRITPIRTGGNHRRYDLTKVLQEMNFIEGESRKDKSKPSCCYARVSTKEQRGDLERQRQILELFCTSRGYEYIVIDDFGSGLNYNKSGLIRLIEMITARKIGRLVLTHKDRLLRFGSEIIFKLCQENDIEVCIINRDEEKTDDNKEFVNDVLEVITHFSSVLYGKRSHKNKHILEQNKKLFETAE